MDNYKMKKLENLVKWLKINYSKLVRLTAEQAFELFPYKDINRDDFELFFNYFIKN